MEPISLIAGSALIAAIISGLIAEWRTREAEKRALKREEAAEHRAAERERRREDRDRQLRQIDDTQADYLGSMAFLIYQALGAPEQASATRWGPEHWPESQIYLVHDADLLRQIVEFRSELQKRGPGGGFTEHDAARMGALQGHVMARLALQRERVRSGQPLLWPSAADVQAIVAKATADHGLPPEYVPKMNPDAK